MNTQYSFQKSFGRDITFESVSPVTPNHDVEVLSVEDKITDPDLFIILGPDRISREVLRQWCFQAKIKHNGIVLDLPCCPIGVDGLGSLLNSKIRTVTTSTLIKWKKYKERKHLNVVFSYMQFMTLLSQDLISLKGGDWLILGFGTECDYMAMAERLRGKYRTITYYLPKTLENAMIFTTDHTISNGITDSLPSLYGAHDICHLWRHYCREGHVIPQRHSCARCALFNSCNPKRSRWHEICRRHQPIDNEGNSAPKGIPYNIY